MSNYPKREQFFAHRFLRILTRDAAAMSMGADACWLLTIIVMQEDACRYRRPVMFWNERLADLCGWADVRTLVRTRSMLVGAGWLHYEPGAHGARKPGAYFVDIPKACVEVDDQPADEGRPTFDVGRDVGRDVVRDGARDVVRDVVRDGVLSTLYPIPNPIPVPCAREPETEREKNERQDSQSPFDGSLSKNSTQSVPPAKPAPAISGRDLFAQVRGMLECYGKDDGIAALDAALLIHKPADIQAAILHRWKAGGQKVPAGAIVDEVNGLLVRRRLVGAKPPPPRLASIRNLPIPEGVKP
jgi:hypothetical protein